MFISFVLGMGGFLVLTVRGGTESSLGEAFNIQTIELDGAISGGKSLFTDLSSSCFHSEELIEATKNYKVYTNHEDFVNEIALSVGLTAKEIEGKGDITKTSSTDTSGTLVEVAYLRERNTISDECLEEATLNPSISHDLNKLPYPIKKPHERAHWMAYDAFIQKWGSHILKSTDAGAKAIYHTRKIKKSIVDKTDLKAKVCDKFSELQLAGCVDTGPKKSSTKDNSDETNDVFVLGGSVETQDKLRAGHFTPEVLDMLAGEAADHQAPIKHEWFSLPELLLHRALFEADSKEGEAQRATALVAYYKGYHVFGCDHLVVEKQNVTVFVNQGDDDFPNFKCLQLRPGCMGDSDCVNWPVVYMGPCYCAGKGCVAVKKEGIKGTKSTELTIRHRPAGKSSDLINYLCRRHATGECSCDKGELEEAWPLGAISLKSSKLDNYKRVNWTWVLIVVAIGLLLAGFGYCGLRNSRAEETKPKDE